MGGPVIDIDQTWEVVALTVGATLLVQFLTWCVVDMVRSAMARRYNTKHGLRNY